MPLLLSPADVGAAQPPPCWGEPGSARELLDRVVSGLVHVSPSLQAAIEPPHHAAVQQITDALYRLDETAREINDHIFASRDHDEPPPSGPPDESC